MKISHFEYKDKKKTKGLLVDGKPYPFLFYKDDNGKWRLQSFGRLESKAKKLDSGLFLKFSSSIYEFNTLRELKSCVRIILS